MNSFGAARDWRRGSVAGALVLAVAAGALAGAGLFTFGYAKGWSYLTNDPAACVNCHVMRDQYSGWLKGSHRKAAVCNDCHTPPGFVSKYATKAINGYFHSFAFTTGWFPDQIQITARNYAVAESACLKCHADGARDSKHQALSRSGKLPALPRQSRPHVDGRAGRDHASQRVE